MLSLILALHAKNGTKEKIEKKMRKKIENK